jgi:enterochelin esterase-like enzyme
VCNRRLCVNYGPIGGRRQPIGGRNPDWRWVTGGSAVTEHRRVPLTSNWTLATLAALAVAAVVATAVMWSRFRSWLHWPLRMVMLVACQLTAVALVAAFVNDAGQFYGSWSELLGSGPPGVSLAHIAAGSEDRRLAKDIRLHSRVGRSLVVSIYVPDAGAARAQKALVYLPAAYFAPSYADMRFPVVELLEGFPGSPWSWTLGLNVQAILDREIASHRTIPLIAVMPTQNYLPARHDGECINAVHGPQVETTLTVNVRRVIEHDFRVNRDRTAWAVMGYSTGGFCALNISLRHPSMYGSAVSLSGNVHPYIDHTTGHLFGRSLAAEDSNDPVWRAQKLPPPVSLLLAASRQDVGAWRGALAMAAAVRPPTRVSLLELPRGGHDGAVWRIMEPVAFDWLAHVIPPPIAESVLAEGRAPIPYRPVRPQVSPALAARHRVKTTRPTFQ